MSPTDQSAASNRCFLCGLFLALLIGGWLRLQGVSELNLTHWDEGPYVGWALGIDPYLDREPLAIYAPPLYPLACRAAFALFGREPYWAICVSASFGLLCILLTGLLARRLFGDSAGACAALLLALDPLHLTYSRMALTETAFTALLLLALLIFGGALASGRRRSAVAAGVAIGLTGSVKYHGFLPLLAGGLLLMVEFFWPGGTCLDQPRARFRSQLRVLVLTGIAALPCLLLLLWFIDHQLGLAEFRETRATWVMGFGPWSVAASLGAVCESLVRFGTPALLALAPVGLLLAAGGRRTTVRLLFATLLVLILILIWYRSYTRLYVPLIALATPLAALTLVRAARRFWPTRPAQAALILTVLAASTGVPSLIASRDFRSDSYPRMGRLLAEQLDREPGAVILVAQQSLYPYLTPEIAAQTFTVTEPEAKRRLRSGEFRYVLTDRRLELHDTVRPHLEELRDQLEELFSIANPLQAPILFDRLGASGYRAFLRDPGNQEFAAERKLTLFQLKAG